MRFTEASELLDAGLPQKIPETCGKGRPLTPENLHTDDREERWRRRQFGRDRAAAFRMRDETAV